MNLAHIRRGDGPPLILVQQLDPPAFWSETVERLVDAHEVVAIDLPGFGRTPPLPAETTPSVAALSDAVAAWIAEAELSDACAVGNSLGGAVCIELAKRRAVAGAVAVSPVGFWTQREAARALRSLRAAGIASRALLSRPGIVSRTSLGRTAAFWQLVSRPGRMSESVARSALLALATSPGFEPTRRQALSYRMEGPGPDVPLTIAWGAKDRMTPPHQARRAAELMPRAEHVTLPGCGHAAMVDDPDLVARTIRESTARMRSTPGATRTRSADVA